MRIFCLYAYLAASALAQNAAPPAFEVASVKINPQMDGRMAIETPGNTLTMRFVTFRVAMAWAYDIQRPRIVGPDWIDTARFDIVAKAPGPATEAEMRMMFQPVLAERFHLTFHRETRQMQVLALTVPKEGHKMTPSTTPGPVETSMDPVRGAVVKRAPLKELVEDMSHDAKMPVLDMTGLTGTFDFAFNIQKYVDAARARAMANPAATSNAELVLSLLQDAMAGELGLKVDSRKAPVELFLIDHAERKPVEN